MDVVILVFISSVMKSSLHYESMFSNSLEQSQELDENVKKTENISKVIIVFYRINCWKVNIIV